MKKLRANESFINNLPDDCLEKIFSFLPIWERLQIEEVCKRWRIIGKRGWNDMKELKIHHDYSHNLIYLILKRCGRFLRKLIIRLSPWHPHCLSIVIKFCQLEQLEEIKIIDIYFKEREDGINIQNLREIFEKSGKLVAVKITGRFSHYVLDYLDILNAKNLRKLDLMNTGYTLSINPDRFPNLKELNLHGIGIIEDEMTREEESLKGLEKMDIGSCVLLQNFIRRICTFTNLQELALRQHVTDVSNEEIRNIARHCETIRKMGLRNSTAPTSDCFQYLGEMQSLEVLHFERFSMNTRHLVYLTNVKKLSFYGCGDIVIGDGLIELIINSTNLEELEFVKIQGLRKPFMDNIGQIFQSGQRKKFLSVKVEGRGNEHLDGLEKITYHPLLDFKIDNDANAGSDADDYDDDE